MGRRGQSITLSISESDKAQLEQIALELGLMWGDRPNISRLVEAIARRQLLVYPNNDWSRDRIQSLNQARNALIDAGQIDAAIAISQLLLERSELTIPLRQEIEQFIQHPAPSWRLEIERYIRRQHPFHLSYQDAAHRIWHFKIFYAAIVTHEQRQYLDCWCQETEGNQDIAALAHNWNFRLDRIIDPAIGPTPGKWRPALDWVETELHLSGGLAFAYTPKPEDSQIEWLTEPTQVRKVLRRVTSSFWLIREVLRYGKDCTLISPDPIRDRLKTELRQLCQQYDL